MQRDYESSENSEIKGFSRKSGHDFLSNFYESTVAFEGKLYPSVEHAYQAAKSLDPSVREIIRKSKSSSEAKKLGQSIGVRADWTAVRLSLMKTLLREKFENPFLRFRLKNTQSSKLIHENRNDRFWGTVNGEGENWLGRLIEEVRDEIFTEDSAEEAARSRGML